ncbi:MAG: DMT family transporter [Tissierellia bacterium]|nr:DMT family transporter [Tissierellia bacterium]
MKKNKIAISFALLAAGLYALNIPIAKILLEGIGPTMMASFLYLGAGIGLFIVGKVVYISGLRKDKKRLTKKELPFTIAMVALDIAAPIFLMVGITITTSANASLLNNFEIVATSLIALLFFHETVSKKLWSAIILITVASIILGFEGKNSFVLNKGSLFVLMATICWGVENNCTRMLSNKDTVEIVTIKGIFSGLGSLLVALVIGESIPEFVDIIKVLLLGFIAYGLSIHFYILAQKDLGAAKTSSFYSVAPFLGVAFSMIILKESPDLKFYIALGIMMVSTILMIGDTIYLQHDHDHVHIHDHLHRHGDFEHRHPHEHHHAHLHTHGETMENHGHPIEEWTDHDHHQY